MKACVIAAPMTGSGKTTVTLGLLSSLHRRGLRVQPFKVGPDFIDAGLHELAAGVPSHNLDGWMLSQETNRRLFSDACAGKDAAIVEGVMGLFDGFDGTSNAGSTAEMARWLNLPVILVVDANPLARSVAAVIHGFRTFDPSLEVAGVIFNRVAGEGHFRVLQEAVTDVPIVGWLPADAHVEIRERHLGLMTGGESGVIDRVQQIGRFFEQHIDVDAMLRDLPDTPAAAAPLDLPQPKTGFTVALAKDPAFSFYYHANRLELERQGASIIEFSAIHDRSLPEADLLYLGGGYPELYRHSLSANVSMRHAVRDFVQSGKRFYAECGGLMYLSRRIGDAEMVGVIPTDVEMTDRPIDFGYCEVTTNRPSIFGPAATRLRGHQFHYSRCTPSTDPIYQITQKQRRYEEGFALANGIASYVHLHFLSNPAVVTSVLES